MMTNEKRATVLLADDHALVAAGLAKLLEEDYELLGTSGDGRSLVAAVFEHRPDIVVMDISMPQLNGLEAARQIKSVAGDTKIIFVTVHADLAYVAAAFRAGGSGYLLKGSAAGELRKAMDEVLAGGWYLTPLIEGASLQDLMKTPEQKHFLTGRQREVLQLVAEGHSAKTIGNVLHISAKTVEFHKAEIMKRLRLHSVAALTRYAIDHGISAQSSN